MTEGELPKYKAMNPEIPLSELKDFIKEIESGEFKVVGFEGHMQNEILLLPNPGGKPITKPTGKKVRTITITTCNQVDE